MGFFDLLRGREQPRQPERNDTNPVSIDEMAIEMGLKPADPNVGKVDGRHYTESVGDVEILKREGRLNEAEALLLRLCDAVEDEATKVSWGAIAPWYYWQLAIIYRQQKNPTQEVAILERYIGKAGQKRADGRFPERLEKAKALLFASENEPQSFCPYCGVEISPMPASGRKCQTCGEKVIVGKRVGEEIRSLLTVAQAEEIKRAEVEARTRKNVLDRAHKLGFDEHAVEKMSAELAEKWGCPPTPRDQVWALSNKAVQNACVQTSCDWAALSCAYRIQADILEEEGHPTAEADLRANDALLRYFEGVFRNIDMPPEVIISTRKSCCPECAKLSGVTVPISEAIANKILPNPDCTNPRCRCSWRGNYEQLRQTG